jgi:hypothetical protein
VGVRRSKQEIKSFYQEVESIANDQAIEIGFFSGDQKID